MIARIMGGLYGLAIGDALGAPVEFMTADEIELRYGQVETMIGGGWLNLQPGEVTDDTNMALCVAQGILANPVDPVNEIGKEFVQWFQTDPPDIGNSCKMSIQLFLDKGDWYLASEAADQILGKSGGNGSLMRTLPIAIAYRSRLEQMLRVTSEVSKMTHWDEIAEQCCQVYNILIMAYLNGQKEKDSLVNQVLELYPALAELLEQKAVPPSGYVCDSLYHAFQSFLKTDNFRDCLIRAVNLGGDADSIGAIAGGLAGTYYGIDEIPEDWLLALDDTVAHKIDLISKKLDTIRL